MLASGLTQKFVTIFPGACSTHSAEHSCEVLLRFEAASHGDIQHARLCLAKHLFRALYPLPQDKLVWALARRLAKHLGEMGRAQAGRLRHLFET
jgi:hypothetical protein